MQVQKYVAELIGTFLLVFIGTSAIVGFGGAFAAGVPTIGFLGIALAFGLTLTVLIYTLGPVSGGHFNPAVTIALVAARKHSAKDLVPYIVVQVIGAIIASAVVLVVTAGFPAQSTTLLGANFVNLAPGATIMGILLMEIVLTFVLVWTILSVTEKNYPFNAFSGLATGLALTVIHLAGIAISSAGVNPARSIGPAILAQGAAITQLWIFLVGPIIGGLVAVGAYMALAQANETSAAVEARTRA